MDVEDPAPDLTYADIRSELEDFGIRDVVDVYSLPEELLATLGFLGRDGARRLHRYARDRLIEPLLAACRGDDDSVQEVAVDGTAVLNVATDDTSIEVVAREVTNGRSDLETREGIEQWVEGVGKDEDSVDELEGEDDEKTCIEDEDECVEDEDNLGDRWGMGDDNV